MDDIKVEITSVSPRQGGEEYAVSFSVNNSEGRTEQVSFLISSKQYLLYAPRAGSSTVAEYEVIERASSVFSATKKAIFLLGYGACSKKRLCDKLRAKGFEKSIAAEAADEIEAMGLLDAEEDAAREAEKCFRKHLGRRRIASELFSKGYCEESVKKALLSLDEAGCDYAESCSDYIKRKYPLPPSSQNELKKIYASLLRRGFTSEEIKKAFRAL